MKKKKSIISLVIALTLVFSCIPVYAATTATPAKVAKVHKISSTTTSVKVGWNKAKNAKQYQLYVSTNGKTGKYKQVVSTKNTNYNLKGYKANTTLWVKVRAVNGKKNGAFSDKVKVATSKKKPAVTEPDPVVQQTAAPGTLEAYRQQMTMFAKSNGNFVFSPISMNAELNMNKAYFPNNETINSLLSGKDCLNYTFKDNTYKSVNRIWVNEKSKIKTPASVKKYEYVMSMQDSSKATKVKNKFVSDNTNGFITSTPTTLGPGTDYDIMNIVYFKDTWKGGNLKVATKTTKFNNTTDVNMLSADSTFYYENDTAYMIPVNYEHGNRMLLIYPKTDVSSVNLEGIENAKVRNKAYISFPPFKQHLSFSLNDSVKGLPNSITQTVKIVVDEKGTEAAAVSEGAGGASAPTTPPLRLTFDKPFMYAIEDTTNGDIAFMGVVYSLN